MYKRQVLKILDSVLVNYLGVELNFLEYLCTAYERHVELCLVDVVLVIGGRKNLALVNIIYLDSLKYRCV